MAVYCTAWTYFGSVGRAASGGVWFLPIYLGPMLAMLLGLTGLDPLTHSLSWSLLANAGLYLAVSMARAPSAQEASQALLFVDVFQRTAEARPVFWRGRARVADLQALAARFLGAQRTQRLFDAYALERGMGSAADLQPDARLVQFVETQLAGAIGSASARTMVASVADEEPLERDTCCASWTRPRSCAATRRRWRRSRSRCSAPPPSCGPPTSGWKAWTG